MTWLICTVYRLVFRSLQSRRLARWAYNIYSISSSVVVCCLRSSCIRLADIIFILVQYKLTHVDNKSLNSRCTPYFIERTLFADGEVSEKLLGSRVRVCFVTHWRFRLHLNSISLTLTETIFRAGLLADRICILSVFDFRPHFNLSCILPLEMLTHLSFGFRWAKRDILFLSSTFCWILTLRESWKRLNSYVAIQKW